MGRAMMDSLDILHLLVTEVIISTWCVGLHLLFRADYNLLFSFIDKWYEEAVIRSNEKKGIVTRTATGKRMYNPGDLKRPYDAIIKPIWGCIHCMASFWTLVLYPVMNDYTFNSIFEIPIIAVSCIALNSIIYNKARM